MEYTLIRRTEGVCKSSITYTVCYSRMLSRLPAKSETCGLCAHFSVGLDGSTCQSVKKCKEKNTSKSCRHEFCICNIFVTNYKRTNWYWLREKKKNTNGNRIIIVCGPWLLSFCSGWLHLLKALGSRLEKCWGDCAMLAGGCNSISGSVTKP